MPKNSKGKEIASVSRERAYVLMKMYHSDNKAEHDEACEEMVLGMQGWIAKIIDQNFTTYKAGHFDDLMQQGNIGVLEGLKTYDPEKAAPTNFFRTRIIHEIQTFIATQINKTTSHYNTNLTKIKKKMAEFDALGVPYSEKDLAFACGISVKTVERCMEIMKSTVSEAEYDDAFVNGATSIQSPEEAMEERTRQEILTNVFSRLPDKMRAILFMRYEPVNGRGKLTPYKDIAKEIGESIEKTKKMHQEALTILRKDPELKAYFTDYIGEIEDRELDQVVIPTTQDEEISEIQAAVHISLAED